MMGAYHNNSMGPAGVVNGARVVRQQADRQARETAEKFRQFEDQMERVERVMESTRQDEQGRDDEQA